MGYFAALVGGSIAAEQFLPPTTVRSGAPWLEILGAAGAVGLFVGFCGLLFLTTLPVRAHVGLSPVRFSVDIGGGARVSSFSWADVRIHERDVVCYGRRRWLPPARFRISARRAARIDRFLRAAPVA